MGTTLYIYRGKQNENNNERIFLYGCAGMFLAFLIWRIFYLWIELTIRGVFINNIYYGDYQDLTPFQIILVKLALISYMLSLFIFIFAMELIIKKWKFILSTIQLLWIIPIIIYPFEYIYDYIYPLILIYTVFIVMGSFFYIINFSQYEFKAIPSFIMLGGSLMAIGFYLCSPIVKAAYSVPLFIPPIIFILGCSIALFPLIINSDKIANALKIWRIIGNLTILDQILIITFHIIAKITIFIFISSIDLIGYIILYHITIRNIKKEHINRTASSNKDSLSNILKAVTKKSIEQIYRLVIENAKDLIIIFNDAFQIELINKKSLQKMLGYSNKNDFIIKNIQYFIHIEDTMKYENFQKNLLLNGEDSTELRVKKKDNTFLWFEINGVLFKDYNQNVKFLTISRDINDKNKLQELLRDENIRLKQMDEIRKEFIAHASHEIKNPLSSLILNLEMLEYKFLKKDFTNFGNILSDVKEKLINVKSLAVNLLDYTLLKMQKSNLKKKQIEISEILINCIKMETLRAEMRGIRINYNFFDKQYLDGDELAIMQVFQNLISNAINYTPKYKKGNINIQVNRIDNKIIISVRDNGIGLTQDQIKNLFIWGSQIDKKSKDIITGSGIGLYLTKQIVEIHGGKIWAESKGLNMGSAFLIELPIN